MIPVSKNIGACNACIRFGHLCIHHVSVELHLLSQTDVFVVSVRDVLDRLQFLPVHYKGLSMILWIQLAFIWGALVCSSLMFVRGLENFSTKTFCWMLAVIAIGGGAAINILIGSPK